MKQTLALAFLCLALTFSLVACTVDQVLDDIDVGIQIASNIGQAVGDVSPADAAAVAVFSSIATGGLQAIQTAYDTYSKSGASTDLQKLQAAIAAVRTNLAQELSAARISNPATQQKVSAWVNLIQTSVSAIAAGLPQFTGSPKAQAVGFAFLNVSAKTALANPSSVPTPQTLQARWTLEVCKGDAKCGKLVHVTRHGASRAAHLGRK